MLSYVNLLPKEDQSETRIDKISNFVAIFFFWVVLSLLILSLLFLVAYVYLKSEYNQISTQIDLQRQVVSKNENVRIKKELNDLNIRLFNLVNLDKYHGNWSEVILKFSGLLPADVAIDSFSADRSTSRIQIIGVAKSRDSVLKLRENLLASDYFENVNFPLSNLIRPTEVSFRYTFFVKAKALLNTSQQNFNEQ